MNHTINNYEIHLLKDYQLLDKIHLLTYQAYVESELITENVNKRANIFPHLNEIKYTNIITAIKDNNIIGTNSLTIDSEYGLHSDIHFKEETDRIRTSVTGLSGSSWRIATVSEYRKNIRLLLDLIQFTVNLAVEKEIHTCVYVFAKKHEEFYKKLIGAETVACKKGFNTRTKFHDT